MTYLTPLIQLLQLSLISTALMLLWQTNLPAHLFHLLRPLTPWLPWTQGGGETRYRDEWFTWINVHLPSFRTGRWWAELLSCPTCLGVHVAGWTCLFVYLAPSYIVQPLTAISTALIFQHLVLRDDNA